MTEWNQIRWKITCYIFDEMNLLKIFNTKDLLEKGWWIRFCKKLRWTMNYLEMLTDVNLLHLLMEDNQLQILTYYTLKTSWLLLLKIYWVFSFKEIFELALYNSLILLHLGVKTWHWYIHLTDDRFNPDCTSIYSIIMNIPLLC